MTAPISQESRHLGALIGLAVGDALGTTVEFSPPGSFEPITDMTGGGPFRLQPGEWTDDTSMALCLAASLVERGCFDPQDQMQRYIRWRDDGYLSSNGECFDIGGTVSDALRRFERTGDAYAGSTSELSAGNGSLMRLAPIPMCYAHDPALAITHAAAMSRTTHGATEAIDACRYYAGLIVGALNGASRRDLLSPQYSPVAGLWQQTPLVGTIETIACGSFLQREPPEVAGTGYVVQSLEAALWAFARSQSFDECVLLAANLGDDADTTAAIAGQLAGAFYGVDAIRPEWRERVVALETIKELALGLFRLQSS